MVSLAKFTSLERDDETLKEQFKVKKGDIWYIASAEEIIDDKLNKSYKLKRGDWNLRIYREKFCALWGWYQKFDKDTTLKLRTTIKESNECSLIHKNSIDIFKRKVKESIEEEGEFEEDDFQMEEYITKNMQAYVVESYQGDKPNWHIYTAIDHKLKKIIAFFIVIEGDLEALKGIEEVLKEFV